MKTALYARVSSEKQAERDLSIPAQLKALRKYALKHGWEVAREFVDEAESARTANRPAFQEMIALAKQKPAPFGAILVWKLSRFARNREDAVLYKALLRKRGIQVVSITEQIDDSPSGKLLEGMLEVIDEFYSSTLAQDTKRGMRENVVRGFLNGSAIPYGYQVARVPVNGATKRKLTVNELEAPVVKQMFQWSLEGEGIREIVNRLNTDSKTTRAGKPWSRTTIHYMLTNPVYTGTLVWNRSSLSRGTRSWNVDGDIIRVPNSHPALIATEQFERVQQLLEQRSPKVMHPRSVASPHLLSGLLFCVKCGARMIAIGAKSGRFSYYTCQSYWRHGKQVCHAKMLNTNKLETFIVNVIKERILTEAHLTRLIELLGEELHTHRTQAGEQTALLEKKLADAERRLSKLYQLIEDDKIAFEEVAPRLRELNEQRDRLKAEQAELDAKAATSSFPLPSTEEVRRYVEDLRETLSQGSIMERKSFVRSFIKRIDLTYPQAEIEYTVPLTPPKAREPLRREVLSIVKNGCPAWIRTKTNRSRVCRATVTLQGNDSVVRSAARVMRGA